MNKCADPAGGGSYSCFSLHPTDSLRGTGSTSVGSCRNPAFRARLARESEEKSVVRIHAQVLPQSCCKWRLSRFLISNCTCKFCFCNKIGWQFLTLLYFWYFQVFPHCFCASEVFLKFMKFKRLFINIYLNIFIYIYIERHSREDLARLVQGRFQSDLIPLPPMFLFVSDCWEKSQLEQILECERLFP